MCVTSHRSQLSNTYILAGECELKNKYRHFLSYSNDPQSMVKGMNTMFIPIPTKRLRKKDFHSTQDYPDLLSQMWDNICPINRGMSSGFKGRSMESIVFKHDIYNVVILNKYNEYETVIEQLPEHKRPDISQEFLDFYAKYYPDHKWSLMLCTFKNKKKRKAPPLFVTFKPSYPDMIYTPLLEGHGSINLERKYKHHQKVMYSSHRITDLGYDYAPLFKNNNNNTHLDFIPHYGIAIAEEYVDDHYGQGDWWFHVDAIANKINIDLGPRQYMTPEGKLSTF